MLTASYKPAGICEAMADEDAKSLTGVVEVGETFLDGKPQRHGGMASVALPAVARYGNARLKALTASAQF